jgi:hypothetical protein
LIILILIFFILHVLHILIPKFIIKHIIDLIQSIISIIFFWIRLFIIALFLFFLFIF